MVNMISIRGSRFFQTGIILMWIAAFLHMVLLCIRGVITSSLHGFSFLDIIDLDMFFPDFVMSTLGVFVSNSLLLVLAICVYYFFTHESRSPR
jgi:hypothetical protein